MKPKENLEIKPRYIDILLLLFKFRYLTRLQIQKLLKLKNHQKVLLWLNLLLKHHYIDKYQTSSSLTIVYSLGKEGRKRLIKEKLVKRTVSLNRVWREAEYSVSFREKNLMIADIYLELYGKWGETLRFWTKSELYGIDHMIEPAPDAYIVIKEKNQTVRLFLEVPTAPRTKNILALIERYDEYFFSSEWQQSTGTSFPQVIILTPNKSAIKTARSYIKENYADEPDLRFVVNSDRSLEKILPISDSKKTG